MVHAVILFVGGSQVRYMPSFFRVSASTLERMTVEWISQPFRLGICSIALAAYSFSETELESAIRISSVCRRGFCCQGSRFQRLDWLDCMGRHEVDLLIDACKFFQCIQQRGGGRTKQRAVFTYHNRAVRQLDGGGRLPAGRIGTGMGALLDCALPERNAA